MAIEDREQIYARRSFIDDDDRERIMHSAGYAPATMADKSTHAICRHGVIAAATDHHHSCSWAWLVPSSNVEFSEGLV